VPMRATATARPKWTTWCRSSRPREARSGSGSGWPPQACCHEVGRSVAQPLAPGVSKERASMLRSALNNRTEVFRYFYWGFWFFLVPAVLAYGAVTWLSAGELVGPLDDFAREQT